ncbi:GIY-YIG nuclease family protein [Pedobacter sandarakinus]|uniref:GIY-YIG nuclease family protein n=1 Tax=Pedobacter sandarakinus TaxID=353156 RepID=UPI002245468A|nr:GIY-YIG nuclease family protein [Pedobacter sandarakinus]MCX2576071.1 GIY-YIG nuclease family protein [Pedobacter sandarakinus]
MERGGCVYIMTNVFNNIYYTGVTSDLRNRIWEHKNNVYPQGFTSKYKCYKLVYFEFFPYVEEAIDEEKRIKGGSRLQKIELIKSLNPTWIDLFDNLD